MTFLLTLASLCWVMPRSRCRNFMALFTKESSCVGTEGICAKNETMTIHRQWKNALTHFYPKKKVLEDGRSTVPLDL